MYKAGIVTRMAGQAFSLEATAMTAGVRLPESILMLDVRIKKSLKAHLTWNPPRLQSTAAQPSEAALARQKIKEKAMQKKAVNSNSFVQNVFRGMIEPTQVFYVHP